MKKLILMTSALTLVGGAAFADITISAKSTVTYGNWETAPGTAAAFDFGTKVTLTLEQTAGDLTYGGELTIEDAKATAHGVIWISGGFGKVSFGADEFDELNADDVPATVDAVNGVTDSSDYGDVKYEGTFGSFGVVLVADAKVGTTPGTGVAATEATWDLGLTYSGGSWNAALDTDSNNAWKISGDASFGNFKVGAAVEPAAVWDVWASTSFGAVNAKLTYDSAAVTGIELDGEAGDVAWAASYDTTGRTKASVDYSMAALSVGVAYDNKDAGIAGQKDRGDEADLQLTVGYAVSDNLSFEIKANDVSEYEVSMTAGFTF